jgi:hypothetical protein
MEKLGRNILVISVISLLLPVLVGLPACDKAKLVKPTKPTEPTPVSDFYFLAARNDINPGIGS